MYDQSKVIDKDDNGIIEGLFFMTVSKEDNGINLIFRDGEKKVVTKNEIVEMINQLSLVLMTEDMK